MKKLLTTMAALLLSVGAPFAQTLTDRGVYHITNSSTGANISAPASEAGNLTCATADASDENQLWIAFATNDENASFYLRNYASGYYMQGNPGDDNIWSVVLPGERNDDNCRMIVSVADAQNNYYNIKPTSDSDRSYAHAKANNNVVSWGQWANASKWSFSQAEDISAEELDAKIASWNFVEEWTKSYVSGGVYRIENAGKSGQCLSTSGAAGRAVTSATSGDGADNQLWQLTLAPDGNGFYFRNLNTAGYLTSSCVTSAQWSVVTTSNPDPSTSVFIIETQGNNLKFRCLNDKDKNYGFAHSDGGNNVVNWAAANVNSQWQFTLIETITPEEAAEKIALAESHWSANTDEPQILLDAMFTDKACTELIPTYSAMTTAELQQDANYLALPETLQQMVLKIHSGNWSETYANGTEWDSDHARKFRLQLYEPFSRGSEGSNCIGVQAYTNMNNPTGLIADNKNLLYVMVNDEIPEGALLTIGMGVDDGLYNDFNGQQQLHQGLNIVPVWDDHSLLYIYYTVDTWDTDTSKSRDERRKYTLDQFSPIKIHIEGGEVNGFFNSIGDELYAADTNEDWQYYRDRARHNMFDLLGEHALLHLHINNPVEGGTDLRDVLDETKTDYDIPLIIRHWDDIIFYQKMLMGVLSDDDIRSEQARKIGYGPDATFETLYDPLEGDTIARNDYHLYMNSRMCGLSSNSASFMNGTSWRAAFNPGTMNAILTGLVTTPDNLWGPAHEFGHINQQPVKIAGTTEESNNMFSNVAIYYRGATTARAELPSAQRTVFNNGETFLRHDTWGTTRMFYQLWLYYHAAGHNRKFYPRLFELLRLYPLEKRGGGAHLESRYDLLHFAKMCCVAAGEDLTDFFESWGFFVVQDDFFIDDYSQWHSYLPQEDIDAVKSEIAAYGYPKNTSIIFIDDRPGSTRDSYADDFGIDKAGSMGGLKDFKEGNIAGGSYDFVVDGTTVTMASDNGGAGFLLYDENGKLVGFSNEPTFTVNAETAKAIATGKVSVQVVGTDNIAQPVADVMEGNDSERKLAQLSKMMASAQSLINKVDPESLTLGRIKGDKAAELQAKYDEIAAKLDENTLADTEITTEYRALAEAYYTLLNDPEAYIDVVEGASYTFTNVGHPGNIMSVNDAGTQLAIAPADSADDPAAKWILEKLPEGKLALRNVKFNKYVAYVGQNSKPIVLADTVVSYTRVTINTDTLAFYPTQFNANQSLHYNTSQGIVRWSYNNAPGSHWIVSMAEDTETVSARNRLNELVTQTETLMNELCSIKASDEEPVALQLDPELMYSNAPYNGNGNDKFTSFSVLLDKDHATYFHSDYSGADSADGLDHYIRITMPDDVDLSPYDYLILNYQTRTSSSHWSPKAIIFSESADMEQWTDVVRLSEPTLPVGNNLSFTSDSIALLNDMRHFRMMVTNSGSALIGGHHFFALSELGLSAGKLLYTPNADMPSSVTPELLRAANREIAMSKVILAMKGAGIAEYNAAYDALLEDHNALIDAKNKPLTDLQKLIEATAELLDEVGLIYEEPEALVLSEELLYTNAEYDGVNAGDRLNWPNLWDGDASTIFHSNYDNEPSADGLDHYIRVTLPASENDLDRFRFVYTTRNNANSTYAPTAIVIEASTDGENWVELTHVTEGLPTASNTQHEMATLQAPQNTTHLRFRVTNSPSGLKGGHHFFALGELGIHKMIPQAEPSTTIYPNVTSPLMTDAFAKMHRANYLLTAGTSSMNKLEAAHNDLKQSYDALLEAKNLTSPPSAIEEINNPAESGKQIIYNLQGTRLSKITAPGVYIINGRKTIVK